MENITLDTIAKFEDFLQEEKNYSFDRAVEVGRYLSEFADSSI